MGDFSIPFQININGNALTTYLASLPTPTNSTKALLCVPPRASSQESTLSKHHHKQPKDTSAHPNQSPLPNSPCQHPASPPPPPSNPNPIPPNHPPNPKASRR